MKRVALILIMVAFALTGCGNGGSNTQNNERFEKKFQVAGETYYNYYMKSVGMTESIITLEMLEIAQENSDVKFDLTGLESCTKTSTVTVIADQTREIIDYAYKLDC